MLDHHRRALDLALVRLRQEPDVSLVLLGGSIAKGTERSDSDVDLIVVTSEEGFARRIANNAASFFWSDLADYPGG